MTIAPRGAFVNNADHLPLTVNEMLNEVNLSPIRAILLRRVEVGQTARQKEQA